MPVDWDALDRDIDEILQSASDRTDEKLAGRISSVTRMTDEEIQELFPESGDKKNLAKLMTIVKSAEDRNAKINQIIANVEEFGGIVLTLLNKFM